MGNWSITHRGTVVPGDSVPASEWPDSTSAHSHTWGWVGTGWCTRELHRRDEARGGRENDKAASQREVGVWSQMYAPPEAGTHAPAPLYPLPSFAMPLTTAWFNLQMGSCFLFRFLFNEVKAAGGTQLKWRSDTLWLCAVGSYGDRKTGTNWISGNLSPFEGKCKCPSSSLYCPLQMRPTVHSPLNLMVESVVIFRFSSYLRIISIYVMGESTMEATEIEWIRICLLNQLWFVFVSGH